MKTNRLVFPKDIDYEIAKSLLGGDQVHFALQWVLNNGWTQSYKQMVSSGDDVQRDIGTPETVRALMAIAGRTVFNAKYTKEMQNHATGLYLITDRVPNEKAQDFYTLWVEGYLLGTDFLFPFRIGEDCHRNDKWGIVPDKDGPNQAWGEFIRYARDKGTVITPANTAEVKTVIDDFCEEYSLSTTAQARFAKHLKL